MLPNINKEKQINDFKLVGLYNKKPSYLNEYGKILGYQVYHSTFNNKVYVIYDEDDKLFYSFEKQYTKEDSIIQNDLVGVIQFFFVKKNLTYDL